MDTKSIYQPGFIHGEISHEMFMHKKLSKNKRDLYGLHKNMVIALALIFSSYLKSTFRIDDLFPATNTTILYRRRYSPNQVKHRQLIRQKYFS